MKRLFVAALIPLICGASPALAQSMSSDMGGMTMPMKAEEKPPAGVPAARPAPEPMAPMAGHDMSAMSGALGAYPMTREASGTSWQPDMSPHEAIEVMRGPWTLMAHATLNGVYDWQKGPRGGEMGLVSGMAMVSARRDLGNLDTINLRAMLSPEPLMGKRGYPLLLATGETADGVTPLVDRQHPHDLFMELSAAYSHRLSNADSLFVYAGLPGEPAFGPPAFMHRLSIMDSPEAPIGHHWLDSTHVTFGVLTAGWIHKDWKIEVSSFRGREPDQRRYDIETPRLDSSAARVSWNPTPSWSLQASWAHVKSPEQLEPGHNQTKWSLSAIHTVRLGADGWWSVTAAWGRRTGLHGDLDAYILESAVKPNAAWTVFGRAERTDNKELGGSPGTAYRVGKVSVGAIRDWRVADHLTLGLGALYAVDFVPSGLSALYGDSPAGAMAFLRLKIN